MTTWDGQPWARHYQAIWHERSGDRRLPDWLRITCLAYGSHRANGHARFKQGQVALVMATVDTTTGEITPMDKDNLRKKVGSAIEYGWLEKGSTSLCLIVPAHAIEGGLGSPTEPCPQHTKVSKRARARRLKVVGE